MEEITAQADLTPIGTPPHALCARTREYCAHSLRPAWMDEEEDLSPSEA